MQWKLSHEQDAYREVFRDWLGSVAHADAVRQWFESSDLDTFESQLFADDWAGVGIAERLGGEGGGLVELAISAEELGRVAAPSAGWLATVLTAPAVGFALEAGITAWAVPADAIPRPTGLRVDASGAVTGNVPRVLAGDRARRFLVVAEGAEKPSIHLVEAAEEGVTVIPSALLDRTRSVADVRFDGAASERVDVDAAEFVRTAANRAAVLVAADALGATHRMLDLAVEYSKQRVQFGVPIGSFQAVKHAAATMLVGVEAARSVVYFAAASVEGGDTDCDKHAAAAKAQVTADGVRAADSALTIHGAIGYTWEHDLHFFYKRAKLDAALYGGPGVWNDRLADLLDLVGVV